MHQASSLNLNLETVAEDLVSDPFPPNLQNDVFPKRDN